LTWSIQTSIECLPGASKAYLTAVHKVILQGFLDQLITVSIQLLDCTGLQGTWYGRNFSWSAADVEGVSRIEFCMTKALTVC